MANASSMPRRPINTRDIFACLITLRLKFPRRRRLHVKIRRSEISAGNHIYTPRARGVYDHHGIYIGEDLGLVIHFQNSLDDNATLGSSIHRFGVCPDCGHHSGRSGVVLSCLDCFLRGGIIYRYEYGCCDPSIPIYCMKWCTSVDSDPPQTVIDRAKLLLTDGFGEYNLVRNNCEDFALFCKTGQHIRSGQIMLPLIQPHAIFLEKLEYIFHFLFGSSLGRGNRNTYSHFAFKMSLYLFQKISVIRIGIGITILIPNITCLFSIPMPAIKRTLISYHPWLLPLSDNFADLDALRRKKWYLYYIRNPRRIWNWPSHCKRYLGKRKKRVTPGRKSQPDSL